MQRPLFFNGSVINIPESTLPGYAQTHVTVCPAQSKHFPKTDAIYLIHAMRVKERPSCPFLSSDHFTGIISRGVA